MKFDLQNKYCEIKNSVVQKIYVIYKLMILNYKKT